MFKGIDAMMPKDYMLAVMNGSEDKESVAKEEPTTTLREEAVPVRKPSRKLYAGILVALIVGFSIGYASSMIQTTDLRNQLQNKQQQYDTLNTSFQNLDADYKSLVGKYDNLIEALEVLYTTTIQEGNVTWTFRTLDGRQVQWHLPLETYVYYVNEQKPTEYHYLTTDGQSFRARKMELLVQPELFSKVIDGLTDGNTARDFVEEVFNLRVQLTTYSEDITDTPLWSAETMTRGAGDCEDFAILMGSLLVAGNEQANYGMTVQMVYMDHDNPTNPQTVNHVLLYITYDDESTEFVDSTSIHVQSPWSEVIGWYFDL